MTDKTPKVTVITPTHNRPDTLKLAIQSVIGQEFQDWEQIIINDGGVDVGEIVQSFGDSRLRYIHRETNRGKAVVLNVALDLARGEYVAYLDDDDIWYPNHLKVLSQALDDHPEMGAAYSDLYAVQFLRDQATGRRYPLNKWIQVARDFNRDFMFHFNHTLHVSLMHRKELAIRAGGYDENVTVLIDWNMTRKLCFYTDFKYVPVVTGEYYMPVGKSDRISNLERQDEEKYKHNLRKIKANLPPEPWPKVHRIGVVLPITRWTEETVAGVTEWIDHIDHPVRYALVNNAPGVRLEECREALGKIADLKNVKILSPRRRLSELEAYRFGAECLDVDFVYLPTARASRSFPTRILRGRPYLDGLGHAALKWDIPEEIESPFDFLMRKKRFLKMSGRGRGKLNSPVHVIKGVCPGAMTWDFLYGLAHKAFREGDYPTAYKYLQECARIQKGGGAEHFLVDLFAKVCFELKNYDEAEDKCRAMIERGYGADNWLRMGKIHQYRGRHAEAVSAYEQALRDLGLGMADISQEAFLRVILPDFSGAFKACIGLGESLIETGDFGRAAVVLRRSARLAPKSPRPFLGFARLFIKTGDLKRARQGVDDLIRRGQISGEVYQVLGLIEEKSGNLNAAYAVYGKGLSLDPADPEIQDGLFRVGSRLGRLQEMRTAFQEALAKCPESQHCARYVEALDRILCPAVDIDEPPHRDAWEDVLPVLGAQQEVDLGFPGLMPGLMEGGNVGAEG